MTISRTQQALEFVAAGLTAADAAYRAGISSGTVRSAMARTRGKLKCPCCDQVVRAGFELRDVTTPERARVIKYLELAAREAEDSEHAALLYAIQRIRRMPL